MDEASSDGAAALRPAEGGAEGRVYPAATSEVTPFHFLCPVTVIPVGTLPRPVWAGSVRPTPASQSQLRDSEVHSSHLSIIVLQPHPLLLLTVSRLIPPLHQVLLIGPRCLMGLVVGRGWEWAESLSVCKHLEGSVLGSTSRKEIQGKEKRKISQNPLQQLAGAPGEWVCHSQSIVGNACCEIESICKRQKRKSSRNQTTTAVGEASALIGCCSLAGACKGG